MSRLCFDVSEGGRSRICALPARGKVSFGSAKNGAIHLTSPGVRPEHGRFDVETMALEALGPGVAVDERPLNEGAQLTLEPGARISLGGAVLDLFAWRPVTARLLSSHDYFEQRGAEECLRCARHKSQFAVLLVQLSRNERDERVEGGLGSAVRLTDVVASYGPGVYEILLFETSSQGSSRAVGRVERILRHLEVKASVGLSVFPQDGTTIDLLTQVAARRARGDGPEPVSAAAPTLSVQREDLEKVARTDLSILILGETGSGKEVMASRVHQLSRRANKPFVTLNCAAFTESLLESELFGHERGSFTGAVATKPGLLETANGGTVFLDEVAEMSLPMQAKILRVLEDHMVMRVGGLKPRPIDVRFIAATNRDLEAAVSRGQFRSDLFYRLDGATLIVQPLRKRLTEFDSIVGEVLTDLAAKSSLLGQPQVSEEALKLLRGYGWPGNIRELRNTLERAMWLAEGGLIERRHLPAQKLEGRFAEFRPTQFRASGEAPSASVPPPVAPAPPPLPEVPTSRRARGRGFGLLVSSDDRAQMAAQERATIERTLIACGGNQTEAARRLGVSRRTLVKRIEVYGLVRPRKTGGGG